MLKVIPRDLFNDGNLLTNYGHLWIQLEKKNLDELLKLEFDSANFHISVDEDGNTWTTNVNLYTVRGEQIEIYRKLNSREKYSLWFKSELAHDDFEVFDSDGALSYELLNELYRK